MSTPITTGADPHAVNYFAPAVPSQGYGLYAAATLLDSGAAPRELLAGIDLYPFNCDTGVGSYSPDICDPEDEVDKAPGERPGPQHFDPLVVWAAAECAPDQTEAEQMARAQQLRALHEPLIIESAFATRLLTDAGAAGSATSLMDAIGQLEVFLGEQGYNGYLHASRKWAVEAGFLNAASGTAVLRTNMGNTWVFGGGYDSALGDTIIATGPLTVWRSAPFEQVVTTGSHVTAAYNNTVYALSERVVTVGYECAAHAVTITTP